MTTSNRFTIGFALSGALLLSGCGGADTTANGAANGTAPDVAVAAPKGGMPADWKATDACSIIDKATMAQVLGTPVTETMLGIVNQPGAATAATSECTYMTGEGRATVMTRWSPIADNTDDAINAAKATMKQTMAAFGGGEVEEVPGLGKRAFWVAKVDQLQSFISEDRMVLITVPSGAGSKDKAIALAKKAGA